MDKSATNGFLRAVELQMRSVEAAVLEINYTGSLCPEAEERFIKLRRDLASITQQIFEARECNR